MVPRKFCIFNRKTILVLKEALLSTDDILAEEDAFEKCFNYDLLENTAYSLFLCDEGLFNK